MAYSFSEKINEKTKQIKQEREKLDVNYKDLGKHVAFFVKDKPFSYCLSELSNYEISLNEYNKIIKKKNTINNQVEQISEYKKEISSLHLLFDDILKTEENEKARYGAAIYEAYSNDKIEKDIKTKLDQVFDNIHIKLDAESKKRDASNIILLTAYHEKRLEKLQKSLFDLFIKSADLMISEDLASLLKIKNNVNYIKSISTIIKKKNSIEARIKECEEEIKIIKNGNSELLNKHVDEMKNEINSLYEAQSSAAILFGKELYKQLPDAISSKEVGLQAITIIDKITVQLAFIDSLNEEINILNNEIQISELSSQISLERKKIKQLKNEIDNCNSQISKIEVIIQKKIDKIIELKDDDVNNKLDFDTK